MYSTKTIQRKMYTKTKQLFRYYFFSSSSFVLFIKTASNKITDFIQLSIFINIYQSFLFYQNSKCSFSFIFHQKPSIYQKMSITAASTEQILEDQLRTDCYALHASRSEVAELQSRFRDVECRYEYLRTVLSNMQRSEDNLRRTLAYETATSDAVINAARRGEPLPPSLAADAATSVLCPPVHLSGKEASKNIFQTASELEQRRIEEKKLLEKEIKDMETVIEAEKRSIGTLQHAMYAQAAWGDNLVKKRRLSQRTHAQMLQEIEDAQKATKSLSHDEQVLVNRMENQKDEIQAKLRRLQEVEDMTRILSLQIEEVKSAVTTGKRDLVRAQTLDAECGQVARIASNKIDDISTRKSRSGSAALLSQTRDSMFNNNKNNTGQSVTTPAYPPQTGSQIGDGTHRYQQRNNNNMMMSSVRTQESPIQFSTSTPQQHQQQSFPPQARKLSSSSQQQGQRRNSSSSPTNIDEIRFTASGSAPAAQQQQNQNTNSTAQQRYQDARADTNEWLRRYVGSMRGLHLTALSGSVGGNQQQ